MKAFPESARIQAPPALAMALTSAAEALPQVEDEVVHDLDVQRSVHERVRSACAEAFDALIEAIHGRLRVPPFSAVVAGLPFDAGHRVLVAVNRGLGELLGLHQDALRAQPPQGIEGAAGKDAASSVAQEGERLHSDCADWPEPVEIVSMLCVRSDPGGGGRTRLLNATALRTAIGGAAGVKAVRRLEEEPVPWRISDSLGGGVIFRPVLTEDTVRWQRSPIDDALGLLGIQLSPGMSDTLDILDRLLARTDRSMDFLLTPGELLFVDNRRSLHCRTPVMDPQAEPLMLRCWVRAAGEAQSRP